MIEMILKILLFWAIVFCGLWVQALIEDRKDRKDRFWKEDR